MRKKDVEREKMINTIVLILMVVLMGSFGQVFQKKGLKEAGGIQLSELLSTKFFSIVFQKYVFVGVLLYLGASVLWLVILSRAELSFAYPLIALSYLVTVILARYFFGESITFFRWFGVLMIIGGAFLIMRS